MCEPGRRGSSTGSVASCPRPGTGTQGGGESSAVTPRLARPPHLLPALPRQDRSPVDPQGGNESGPDGNQPTGPMKLPSGAFLRVRSGKKVTCQLRRRERPAREIAATGLSRMFRRWPLPVPFTGGHSSSWAGAGLCSRRRERLQRSRCSESLSCGEGRLEQGEREGGHRSAVLREARRARSTLRLQLPPIPL